jgi:hypothetical protein
MKTLAEDVPLMPPLAELPESVSRLREDRARKFVWFYMMGGANGAEAARAAGFSDHLDAAKVRAHHLLHRSDVQAALRDLGQRYLYNLMPKALVKLDELLDSKNAADRGKAIDRVLNRVPGFSERTGLDVNVQAEVTVNHTTAAVEDLRRLVALGVPREKLIETFGFSGLARYERMLAELDARAPKVIEGEVTARE